VIFNRAIPSRDIVRRPRSDAADLVIALGVFAVLYELVRLGHSMSVTFIPGRTHLTLQTGTAHLPYYAALSLARMLIALGASTVFSLVYATAAARLPRAGKILLPALDILQSVPVLGFLTFTVVLFIRLFPGSILGLECASIFAVFTSQAWNMTFSFYQSLVSQPIGLDEAARLYRLTKWQRFWKLDVPSGTIGLVWNAMMSMGGGWFFLTASEAISVNRNQYTLPGIGSYIGAAISQGSITKVLTAIAFMIVIVIGVNVLLFRPLVAWAEKFRLEDSEPANKPKSVVLELLRRSDLPRLVARARQPVTAALDRLTRPFGLAEYPLVPDTRRRRTGDLAFWAVIGAAVALGVWSAATYLTTRVSLHTVAYVVGLGAVTFGRVVVVVVVSTLIWAPVGATIGMNPRLASYAQPVVQILASFPANLLFPFAVIAFIALHLSLNIGGILLMTLGAQWYILFNAIAGASAIPNDLREMVTCLAVSRRQRWRQLVLPAIFPTYVTGGITAAGGAWNASIVAEVASWGSHHLSATGLGAYIAESSASGAPNHFADVLLGIAVMSVFVVGLNRLFWRRLYGIAERRYSL
jgi:NitT/TauT family transport system permease protein